jgi:hypothetical protein
MGVGAGVEGGGGAGAVVCCGSTGSSFLFQSMHIKIGKDNGSVAIHKTIPKQ